MFEGWSEHSYSSCSICQHFESVQKGGRPKKAQHTTGHPRNDSPRYCIQAIQDIAPPAIMLAHHTNAIICEEHQVVDLQELECPTSCDVLQRPVELVDCCRVVSADCCCTWLEYSTNTNCPCCHGDHLCNFSSVRQASPLLLSVLASLCVVCVECGDHMRQDTYSEHADSSCQSCSTSSSQDSPDTSIDKIINRPLSTPLTAVEQKHQSRLAKRSLATSPEENVLKIKTGRRVSYHYYSVHLTILCTVIVYLQPLTFLQVPQPRVVSTKASNRSLCQRTVALRDARKRVSANDSSAQVQLSHEIKSCTSDVRRRHPRRGMHTDTNRIVTGNED